MQRSGWWTEVACCRNTYPASREEEKAEVEEQEVKRTENEELRERRSSKQASTEGKNEERKKAK